jgi:hypothetical protein
VVIRVELDRDLNYSFFVVIVVNKKKVYDQDKLDELISKEIIHFSIQKEIINETVLGLEVCFYRL